MATPYKWTIPPELVERARYLAEQQQRELPDVVAEALDRGLPLVESSGETISWALEANAFRQMHAALVETYAGQYVAVFKGEVVDHDRRFAPLLERITQRFPDDFVMIRPVQAEPEIVYEHRAIRWE